MTITPIPTIGRIVLYRAKDGEDRPAIITQVHTQFCVNLYVFPKSSTDMLCGAMNSVTHIGPETGETPGKEPSWRWMPYQLQTAGTRHPDLPQSVGTATQEKPSAEDIERAEQMARVHVALSVLSDVDSTCDTVEVIKKATNVLTQFLAPTVLYMRGPSIEPTDVRKVQELPAPTVPQSDCRVTQAQIDALIAASTWTDAKMGEKTTVVCCKLPNGFEVIESSGCVDPTNYDHKLGVEICRKRIVDRIWMLEGYALADRMNRPVSTAGFATDAACHTVEHIARVCHEVNRALCIAYGDMSQKPWDEAEQWQRDSAIKGVQFAINNPTAPASAQHDAWMADKIANGWREGLVKDSVAKTHPCIVPYEQLPIAQQVKDHTFRAIVRALT